jgi:NAD(P)H-dependent FMN reductase
MKLTVFNGSPRGKGSNTHILLEQFLKGFVETPGCISEIFYLNHVAEQAEFLQAFNEADCVLLAFPLYTDSMPGIVKVFIETLAPLCERENNPPIGFIVQSGFPESTHSRHVEKYLAKLAQRLNSRYLGTVIKGGVEGIQVQPEKWTRKLFDAFYHLGQTFGSRGVFDEILLKELAKPEKISSWSILGFRIFSILGLTNFYWDSMLKKNGAYEKRFAKPYE